MPKFLAGFVPVGLMGILIAAMLAADMSTDSSYMLTWGSVIYNDILRPVPQDALVGEEGARRQPLHRRRHRRVPLVLRLWYQAARQSVGLLDRYRLDLPDEHVDLLIAACYWKRANNWGAAAAIIVGAVVPVVTLVLQKVGPWQQQWFVD